MSKDLINGEASIPCIWHGMTVTLKQGVEDGARSRGGAEPNEGSYMFYGYTVDIVAMQNSGKYFLY